jgi:hypothetical protein
MSFGQLATVFHALAAQIETDRFILNVGFERRAVQLRQHSIGYNRTTRQSDIAAYVPGKDDPLSCATGGASVRVIVRLSSCGRLYFFLRSATASLRSRSLVGPFHSPPKHCYVVERQARSGGQCGENQISIAFLARQSCDWRRMRFLFFNGNMGNIRTMNNIVHTQENGTDMWNNSARVRHVNDHRPYSPTHSQDKWVFYNY